jgi:hypothetical protein
MPKGDEGRKSCVAAFGRGGVGFGGMKMENDAQTFLNGLYQEYTTQKLGFGMNGENKFGKYFFRGQLDSTWELLPSAYRNSTAHSLLPGSEERCLRDFIYTLYHNGYKGNNEFKKNFIFDNINIRQPDERTLYFMHLGKHYAFDHKSPYKSSLLDITLDIKMALLFSVLNDSLDFDGTKDGALFVFAREKIENNTDNIKLYNLYDDEYRTTNGTTRLQIQSGAFLYREQKGKDFDCSQFKVGEKIEIPKEIKKDIYNTLQPEVFKQMLYAPQIYNTPELNTAGTSGCCMDLWRQNSDRLTMVSEKIGLHRSDQWVC